MLRSPIIVTVGHIDHGKTTLLDAIRGTKVTQTEAGKITQHVGASYIPTETIERIAGDLMKKMNIKLTIPGLLFIDTPGHAAFTSLRRRGGSIADLAILVVDINEGFKEQTHESLKILKEFKVPFVVAATKIDKINGWFSQKDKPFLESIKHQDKFVVEELDKKIYSLVASLMEEGFNAERFDRVKDFTKEIAIVPVSGITREGIPELLMILAGLAQQFLKDQLQISDFAKGSILEVKEEKGLGTTVDVILYDGKIKRGDYMVIAAKEPIVTKIRAILRPRPLQELRVEKKFESVDEATAAAGVKILAPGLENVIAGSPVYFSSNKKEIEKLKQIAKSEISRIEFDKEEEGVIIKADTLGSLEAMIKILSEKGIPIKKAEVGSVTREDIVEASTIKDKYRKAILVFNQKVKEEVAKEANEKGIKIFVGSVIYRLIEEYENWIKEEKAKEARKILEQLPRPAKIKVIPGAIFRQSKPAIFGVDVLSGVLKPGSRLKRKDGKIIGKVKEIQSEGRTIPQALKGQRVAISVEEVVVGRHIKEGDVLSVALTQEEIENLKKYLPYLSEDEKELLQQM